jgi:general secretion pathway protein D
MLSDVSVSDVSDGEIGVACDEATNSLLTTSSLRDYARLRNVIDKLDQPRRQVFIEAVIMDVNIDHNRDLGLGFHGGATAALGGGGDTLFFGGNNAQQSLSGIPGNLEALAFGVRGPDIEGTSNLGLGLPGVSIPGFGITLHALAQSGDSNVLATPHLLATDNITAEINIGQNIPLQTNIGGGLGSLAGLAGGAAGALGGLGGLLGGGGFSAPRTDVGIKLKITPHINDSDQVRMELTEEFSDAGSPIGALGAVPINKRTATTTVIVRDQQTVVIGGLVREGTINGETKVPILGDIPVLGALFRQTQKKTQKTNLLLILTPHIVRNQNDLRAIFERKMQERQEFLDRYFVFNDTATWEPLHDYTRANGMVEHIRQSQLRLAERARLAAEMKPDAPKSHAPIQPIELPSIGSTSSRATPTRTSGKRRNSKSGTKKSRSTMKKRPKFSVPGGLTGRSKRHRVE